MGQREFIFEYVRSCTYGGLNISDCAPVWQFAAIAVVLVVAIVTLVILRLRAATPAR